MRPELRPERPAEGEDTPRKSGVRWHHSFAAFPVAEDVQISMKTARKIVDIIATSQKLPAPETPLKSFRGPRQR